MFTVDERRRFIVRADEKLTASAELASVVRSSATAFRNADSV